MEEKNNKRNSIYRNNFSNTYLKDINKDNYYKLKNYNKSNNNHQYNKKFRLENKKIKSDLYSLSNTNYNKSQSLKFIEKNSTTFNTKNNFIQDTIIDEDNNYNNLEVFLNKIKYFLKKNNFNNSLIKSFLCNYVLNKCGYINKSYEFNEYDLYYLLAFKFNIKFVNHDSIKILKSLYSNKKLLLDDIINMLSYNLQEEFEINNYHKKLNSIEFDNKELHLEELCKVTEHKNDYSYYNKETSFQNICMNNKDKLFHKLNKDVLSIIQNENSKFNNFNNYKKLPQIVSKLNNEIKKDKELKKCSNYNQYYYDLNYNYCKNDLNILENKSLNAKNNNHNNESSNELSKFDSLKKLVFFKPKSKSIIKSTNKNALSHLFQNQNVLDRIDEYEISKSNVISIVQENTSFDNNKYLLNYTNNQNESSNFSIDNQIKQNININNNNNNNKVEKDINRLSRNIVNSYCKEIDLIKINTLDIKILKNNLYNNFTTIKTSLHKKFLTYNINSNKTKKYKKIKERLFSLLKSSNYLKIKQNINICIDQNTSNSLNNITYISERQKKNMKKNNLINITNYNRIKNKSFSSNLNKTSQNLLKSNLKKKVILGLQHINNANSNSIIDDCCLKRKSISKFIENQRIKINNRKKINLKEKSIRNNVSSFIKNNILINQYIDKTNNTRNKNKVESTQIKINIANKILELFNINIKYKLYKENNKDKKFKKFKNVNSNKTNSLNNKDFNYNVIKQGIFENYNSFINNISLNRKKEFISYKEKMNKTLNCSNNNNFSSISINHSLKEYRKIKLSIKAFLSEFNIYYKRSIEYAKKNDNFRNSIINFFLKNNNNKYNKYNVYDLDISNKIIKSTSNNNNNSNVISLKSLNNKEIKNNAISNNNSYNNKLNSATKKRNIINRKIQLKNALISTIRIKNRLQYQYDVLENKIEIDDSDIINTLKNFI